MRIRQRCPVVAEANHGEDVWFQHPNGALPAYEWDFGDVNPSVQAWVNWWVNLEDETSWCIGQWLYPGGHIVLAAPRPADGNSRRESGRAHRKWARPLR